MTTDGLTAEQWKRRALRAEGAVRYALWMRPLTRNNEGAAELADRLRLHIEVTYPDLIVRHRHRPVEVFKWADGCDCPDTGSDGYENDHSESGEDGEPLCGRSFLGLVCEVCRDDEDCAGPEWRPEAVLWPCPPIRELDAQSDVSVLRDAMSRPAATGPAEDGA
jgi:hypothetical protein